jgi:hypothetical protein
MKNSPHTAAPAIAEDSLTILRDVSHLYETAKQLRKLAARAAQHDGHTYQQLSDALGINRSNAYKLVNRDAA